MKKFIYPILFLSITLCGCDNDYKNNSTVGYKDIKVGIDVETIKKSYDVKSCILDGCTIIDHDTKINFKYTTNGVVYLVDVTRPMHNIPTHMLIAELNEKYGKPKHSTDTSAKWCFDKHCEKSISLLRLDEKLSRLDLYLQELEFKESDQEYSYLINIVYTNSKLSDAWFDKKNRQMRDF